MSSYLVFAIAHCCQFPKLSICKKVDCEFDPVTFWYQTSIDIRDLEGELFNIKIRHEINVAPMESYIEEWFKKAIDKLTNEGQEAVETVPVTVNENDKRTSVSK
jgi:hypothetical protein